MKKIKLFLTEYNGFFYVEDEKEPLYSIGNAEIARSIAELLKSLGHDVTVEEQD